MQAAGPFVAHLDAEGVPGGDLGHPLLATFVALWLVTFDGQTDSFFSLPTDTALTAGRFSALLLESPHYGANSVSESARLAAHPAGGPRRFLAGPAKIVNAYLYSGLYSALF